MSVFDCRNKLCHGYPAVVAVYVTLYAKILEFCMYIWKASPTKVK